MEFTLKKRGALHSEMGRPIIGEMSTFSDTLKTLIKKIRQANEGFGATSILTELEHKYAYTKKDLPSRSTITAFLKKEGLTKIYERHSNLPTKPYYSPTHAHQLWQLDGRGNEQVEGVGTIALLDIKDVYSCTYVSYFPSRMKTKNHHPTANDYQITLRLGFMQYGLPKGIQVDHASVFYENKSKSPFPTRLHLWIVGLGIKLHYSRVHRPTDQAKVERSHEIVFNQVLKGRKKFKNWTHLFVKVKERVHYLNYLIPSTSCNDQPPLVACPQAAHSGRNYNPLTEQRLLNMDIVYDYLTRCKWYRKVASNKTVSLGGQVYYLTESKPKEQLEIVFCNSCKHLLFHNDNELLIDMLPIKGMTPEYLMGKLGDLYKIPTLQLSIPFDWEDESLAQLF